MPLRKGKSEKVISTNIKELMKKPGKTRQKAVKTIAKEAGITPKQAKQRQAIAIALSAAGKTKTKK
jgi:hypothetical protein